MNIKSHLNTTQMRNTITIEVMRTQGMKVKSGAVLYGNTGQFRIVFHALPLFQYTNLRITDSILARTRSLAYYILGRIFGLVCDPITKLPAFIK